MSTKRIISFILIMVLVITSLPVTMKAAGSKPANIIKNLPSKVYIGSRQLTCEEGIYAEDDIDNELFSVKKGVVTIKKKFIDNFALTTYQTFNGRTSVMEDGKSYTYDDSNKCYTNSDGDELLIGASVNLGQWEDELNEWKVYVSKLKNAKKPIFTLTVDDDVTSFPAVTRYGDGISNDWVGLMMCAESTYQYFKNVVLPSQVKRVSDGVFFNAYIENVYVDSEEIKTFSKKMFMNTVIKHADFSKLDEKITEIGDYCFYKFNTSKSIENLSGVGNIMEEGSLKHYDCIIKLPHFNNVNRLGISSFLEASLDNTEIDFSNNQVLENGWDVRGTTIPTASMFCGVVAHKLNLKNCTQLKDIGYIAYCDLYEIDLSGCSNIVSLGSGCYDGTMFVQKAGYTSMQLYYSQIDKVILPKSLISMGDRGINHCNIGEIDLSNVKFIQGNFLGYEYNGQFNQSANVNKDVLFDRGIKNNLIYNVLTFKKLDLSSVVYWGVQNNQFHENASMFDETDTGDFEFVKPRELTWINAINIPSSNPALNGYSFMIAEDGKIGSMILKEMREVNVSDHFMRWNFSYVNTKYGVTGNNPQWGLCFTLDIDPGSNVEFASIVSMKASILKEINKNGIDDFINNFVQTGDGMDNANPKYALSNYYTLFNSANPTNVIGYAMLSNEDTTAMQNYYKGIKSNIDCFGSYSNLVAANGSEDLIVPALPYLKEEYMTKIDNIKVNTNLADQSDEYINSLTETDLKSILSVECLYNDGHKECISEYSIKDFKYENNKVSFQIYARNLSKVYEISKYGIDVDSEHFLNAYDFTVRKKNMSIDIKRSIDDITLLGDTVVKPMETKYYQSEVLHTGYLANKNVDWELSGATDNNTQISNEGNLQVGENETAKYITIKAMSSADHSVYKTKKVKIAYQASAVNITGRDLFLPNANDSFNAVVEKKDLVSQDVTWFLEGNQSSGTKVKSDGSFVTDKSEAADELIVSAVSDDESGNKKGMKTIKLYCKIVGDDVVEVNQKGQYNIPESDYFIFSMRGNKSNDTKVSKTGSLFVAEDEGADSITLVYANKLDSNEKLEKNVTIKQRVDSVTVHGKNELYYGDTTSLTAEVKGSPNAPKTVSWLILGNTSADTRIDGNGKLIVGDNETANQLTIKATSTYDTSKSGTHLISLKKMNTLIVEPKKPEKKIAKNKEHILVASKVIAKGDTFAIKILNSKGCKIKWKTSKKGVVSIKGMKIHARKNGKTTLTCTVVKNSKLVYRFKVKVIVKNTGYHTLNTEKKKTKKLGKPKLLLDKTVFLGSKYKFKFKNYKGAKISYSSYNKKIVKIKGNSIVPKKEGYTYLIVSVNQNGKTTKYMLHVKVQKKLV